MVAGAYICGRRVVVDTQRLMMQAHAGIGSVSSPAALERLRTRRSFLITTPALLFPTKLLQAPTSDELSYRCMTTFNIPERQRT